VFGLLSTIALVLASIGLYAVTAHRVAQRRQEIGVRTALGASARQVMWLFVRRTVAYLAIGVTVGGVGCRHRRPVADRDASADAFDGTP
jgi:ABC-type antimicrobial peptide transport system permease subunit